MAIRGLIVCKLYANKKKTKSINLLKPFTVLAPQTGLEPVTL